MMKIYKVVFASKKMKRYVFAFLFAGVFLFLAGGVDGAVCSDAQRILRLSGNSNAHGEIYSGVSLGYDGVCYDSIFAGSYGGATPHPSSCTLGNGLVLRLSSITNAHAEGPAGTSAGYFNICYGDLSCRLVGLASSCDTASGEREVVRLSGTSNAHLAVAGTSGYGYKVCCSEPSSDGCTINAQCPTPLVCNLVDQTCVECTVDTNCQSNPNGPICNPDTDRCVECLNNGQCENGESCNLVTNTCEPVVGACVLNSAEWRKSGSAIVTAKEGDNVNLVVTGSNCNEDIRFEVFENDPLVDDFSGVQPIPVSATMSGGVNSGASTQWVVQYEPDTLGDHPEYYFKATLVSDATKSIHSADLDVFPLGGPCTEGQACNCDPIRECAPGLICSTRDTCQSPKIESALWSNDGTDTITDANFDRTVKLVANTEYVVDGETIKFEIKRGGQKIDIVDDNDDVLEAAVNNGKATYNWIIQSSSFSEQDKDDGVTLIFTAYGSGISWKTSEELSVTKDITVFNIGGCAFYTDEDSCDSDSGNRVEGDDEYDSSCRIGSVGQCTISCACEWEDNECGFVKTWEGEDCGDGNGGSCRVTYQTDNRCVDDFKTINIIRTINPSGATLPSGVSCSSDTKFIPCGLSIVELPFAGGVQLILAIVIIALLYIILARKKIFKRKK